MNDPHIKNEGHKLTQKLILYVGEKHYIFRDLLICKAVPQEVEIQLEDLLGLKCQNYLSTVPKPLISVGHMVKDQDAFGRSNSPVTEYYISCRPVIRICNGSLRLPVANIDLCLSPREMQHDLYQSSRSFSPIQRLHEKRTLGFFLVKLLKLFT